MGQPVNIGTAAGACGGSVAFCGCSLTICMLGTIAMAAIYSAIGLTIGFNPRGLSNAWNVTKWAAITVAIGIALLIIGAIGHCSLPKS